MNIKKLIQSTDQAIIKARSINMGLDEFLDGAQEEHYRQYVTAKWKLSDVQDRLKRNRDETIQR